MTRWLKTDELQARATEVSGLLKLLSHPTRLLIVCELRGGEVAVSALEQRIGAAQPSLSRDLGRMRDEGLLAARREAKSVYYRIADDRLVAIIDALCDAFSERRPVKEKRKVK